MPEEGAGDLTSGVKNGTLLKLAKHGHWRPKPQGGEPLYVEVRVAMTPGWRVRGLHVYAAAVNVDLWTALLVGGEIAVPMLDPTENNSCSAFHSPSRGSKFTEQCLVRRFSVAHPELFERNPFLR